MYIHMYSGLKPPPGKITRAVSVLVPIIRPFIVKLPPPLPFTPTTRLDFSRCRSFWRYPPLDIRPLYPCFAILWPISSLPFFFFLEFFSILRNLFLGNLDHFILQNVDIFWDIYIRMLSKLLISFFFWIKIQIRIRSNSTVRLLSLVQISHLPSKIFQARSTFQLIKSAMQEHILLLVISSKKSKYGRDMDEQTSHRRELAGRKDKARDRMGRGGREKER